MTDNDWACPACSHLRPTQGRNKLFRATATVGPTWEPEKLSNEWSSLKRRVSECKSRARAPDDTSYDNLDCQGFDLHPISLNTWKTTQADIIMQKAVFDVQPTNPELEIQPTGKFEIWIREVNLIAQVYLARTEAHCIDPESPISPANHATFLQASDATRACIYTPW